MTKSTPTPRPSTAIACASKRIAVLLLMLFAGWAASSARAAPRVIASIAPLHSLTASIMAGVGKPRLLLAASTSPHMAQLRPNDARALARADLVIWIGAPLEAFLKQPIAALARGSILTLAQAPAVVRLAARGPGLHGPAVAPLPADLDPRDTERQLDPHLWLDPQNARAMARAISAALAAIDPRNRSRYRANEARLDRRLAALDRAIGKRLHPLAATPFVTLHDAFQYLERHYRLHELGALISTRERMPGARTVAKLRAAMSAAKVRCVVREPQVHSPLLNVLTDRPGVRIAVLDPIGATLTPGPGLYSDLMRANSDALVACLAP